MIPLRKNIQYHQNQEVFCAFNEQSLSESDRKEFIAYQKTDQQRSDNKGIEVFDDIVFKSNLLKHFNNLYPVWHCLEMKKSWKWVLVRGGQVSF
jgi:hypothetical protein